jgi:hypothetical protein
VYTCVVCVGGGVNALRIHFLALMIGSHGLKSTTSGHAVLVICLLRAAVLHPDSSSAAFATRGLSVR